MSRAEAVEQYNTALKKGRKYYSARVSRGEDPYPRVLQEILGDTLTSQENLGIINIPADRIVGTWVDGRKHSFAGNFMPLLDMDTEFGAKWVHLCEAHLNEGITDPISCFEYMGAFYVREGHKRVSVLRSFDAPAVTASVVRLIPPLTDDPQIKQYYEFLEFYHVTRLYLAPFSQPGDYTRLLSALGYSPDSVWPDAVRRSFFAEYQRFSVAFHAMNKGEALPLTVSDALLMYLKVYPYTEMKRQSREETRACLTKLWPDMRLLAQGQPISVSTAPEEKAKSLVGRILDAPRLHAAFLYDADPQTSAWAAAHENGQKYLEQSLGDGIKISAYLCKDHPDEAMKTAVQKGANVFFATSPKLMDACRRLVAKHKNVAVFNCSLSLPYAGVRSYYCRIYEGKFIAGAIAGAMAGTDAIGYVANYPIMGATAAINAFALGAKLTNPRDRIILKWSCLPGNPILELKKAGITVISNRDEDGASTGIGWDLGTYAIMEDDSLMALASPRWNWGKYYEKTIQSLLNSGVEALRDEDRAVTDWWGMSTGVVSVDTGEGMPEGVKRLTGILKDGIIRGELDPFRTVIRDQKGRRISDGERVFLPEELMKIDWLCDSVEGYIPGYDELRPQSQALVRLLGLYRHSIPPQAEGIGP